MIVTVNGSSTTFTGSIADLVESHFGDRATRGIAVAVNGVVVARSTWEAHRPAVGDRIEIVTAVQGG